MSKKGRFIEKRNELIEKFKHIFVAGEDDFEEIEFIRLLETSNTLNQLKLNLSKCSNTFCPSVFRDIDKDIFFENSSYCYGTKKYYECTINARSCWASALDEYFRSVKK